MDSNPLVAAMVGLVTASSMYIWKSNRFNKTQKALLLLCFVFPPLQWVMILIVIYYNENEYKKSKEFKNEIYNNKKYKEIDNSKNTLYELKNSGIITDEEYKAKVEKIDNHTNELDILNSKEYNQLKSLLDLEILTKDEFENKLEILRNSKTKNKIIEKVVQPKIDLINTDSIVNENKSTSYKDYFLSILLLMAIYLIVYIFFN